MVLSSYSKNARLSGYVFFGGLHIPPEQIGFGLGVGLGGI